VIHSAGRGLKRFWEAGRIGDALRANVKSRVMALWGHNTTTRYQAARLTL